MKKIFYNLSIRDKILLGFFIVFIIFFGVGFNHYNTLIHLNKEKSEIIAGASLQNYIAQIRYLKANNLSTIQNLSTSNDLDNIKKNWNTHININKQIKALFDNIENLNQNEFKISQIIPEINDSNIINEIKLNILSDKGIEIHYKEIYRLQKEIKDTIELKNEILQKFEAKINQDTSSNDSVQVVPINSVDNILKERIKIAQNEKNKHFTDLYKKSKEVENKLNKIEAESFKVLKKASANSDELRRKSVNLSIIILVIGIILSLTISYLISKIIINSLSELKKFTQKMAKGELPKDIDILEKDEIGDMGNSILKLKSGLEKTSIFAYEIGKGDFSSDYKPLSDKDVLGNSLLNMRKSLLQAKEEEDKRKQEDIQRNWTTEGLAKFAEILRHHTENIKELSNNIIINLVKYLNANQGGIFIMNDTDPEDVYLELLAAYAYNRKKYLTKKIGIGEGLVGAVANEKFTVYLTDIPNEYIEIESGIGSSNPKCILIVPLKIEDQILGVIELASFNELKKYEIELVEKIAESIASTLSTARINTQTAELLEQSKHHAKAMKEQEEEMRQTIEEMQATQEESLRREETITKELKEYKSIVKTLEQQNSITNLEIDTLTKEKEKLSEKIKEKKYLEKNILETANDSILETDYLGNISYANVNALKFLNYKSAEIIGRNINKIIEFPEELDKEFTEILIEHVEQKFVNNDSIFTILDKNNKKTPCQIKALKHNSNDNEYFVFFIKDLSELEKESQKLQKTKEEMMLKEFEYSVKVDALEFALKENNIQPPKEEESDELLHFEDGYKIGLNIIDQQHKKWIDIINSFYKAFKTGESKKTIEINFAELLDYTEYHFGFEEKYLQDFKFENYEEHKKIHDNFSSTILDMLNKYKAGNDIAAVELLLYLKKWVKEHINMQDIKYIDLFKHNGLS